MGPVWVFLIPWPRHHLCMNTTTRVQSTLATEAWVSQSHPWCSVTPTETHLVALIAQFALSEPWNIAILATLWYLEACAILNLPVRLRSEGW